MKVWFCAGSSTSSRRRGGVAAEVGAELVDLVEHHDRVARAGLADLGDDPAGHGADVGAAVAADVGLVAHAAEGDADELAAHGLGDALAQGGLADAGRADEAEDRAAAVGLELADGQVLDDPAFDLLQVVVVAVEDAARLGQVELVLGRDGPGQLADDLEIGADDAVFGRGAGDGLQAVQFAVGLLHDVLGQLGGLELLAQLLDLRLAAAAARSRRVPCGWP